MNQTETPTSRLDLLLEDYLVQHTNYALLLTAPWGAGKTYYLKNHFFNRIDSTGYKPILVSLFGIKSIDDIKDRIFAELYPVLENKNLKITKTVLKLVAKSIDLTKLIGKGMIGDMLDNFEEAAKEIKSVKKENLELDKMLICFDDLERANPEMLSSSEILGYINSLVEDDNIKVIIIANEGEMSSVKYLEVKEKTIGNTIHFNQDFNDVFLSILEKGDQPSVYCSFLQQHQELIADLLSIDKNFKKGKVNYRTLTYFISYFSQIFQFVDKGFKIEDIDSDKDQVLTRLLRFSLFVCNECKKGFFTFSDRKGFDDPVSVDMLRYLDAKRNDTETKSGKILQVIDLYYQKEDFYFYGSIYDYLTGGDFFDRKRSIGELKGEYHVLNESVTEAYKVYNKLANVNYLNFSDAVFRELTRQMKDFAIAGHYELQDYISILYYVLRHGNVLNLKPQRFTMQLLTQIRKKLATHHYNPLINQYTTVSEEAEFYKWSVQLRDEILKVNNKSGLQERSKVIAQIEYDLSHDYPGLHQRLIKGCNTPHVVASFSGVKASKFFRTFQKGDNQRRSMIETLLRIVYMPKHGNNSEGDLKFLTDLESLIEGRGNKLIEKNISGALYKALLKAVKSAIAEVLRYQPVLIDTEN